MSDMSQLLILFLYTLTFKAAGVLAAHIHPNHLQGVSSSGFACWPPTCNSKFFGHVSGDHQIKRLTWLVYQQL
ncbi:hypothetical protein CU276_05515 [Yersinia kristensenii]|nr:hypothetical protein CU276_05515 [Yersinia kristensenii]